MTDYKGGWKHAEQCFQLDPSFKVWTKDQQKAFDLWVTLDNNRILLFYPTGRGKTKTSLGLMYAKGYRKTIVIAPPATHKAWETDARSIDMSVITMSVEKFRKKETRLPRDVPIIVDEVHLLGKHGSMGISKLDRVAPLIPAIILASATPNYNDADRAYNIVHALDPTSHRGGYVTWLYRHCETKTNPFSTTPYVQGFQEFDSAADFLVAEGYTAYIKDDAVWTEEEFVLATGPGKVARKQEIIEYGYDRHRHKMIASDMERRHRLAFLDRVNPETNRLWPEVLEQLREKLYKGKSKPWLLFCQHSTVAEALYESLQAAGNSVYLITGKTTKKQLEAIKYQYINDPNPARVLVGTSTLATGMDGLNKVCDRLLIFDDIEGDDSKRRQLIGRVLPRGTQQRSTYVAFAR